MAIKRFHSRLSKRYIEPNDNYYWKFVYAELLFSISELEVANCSCINCQAELSRNRYSLNFL
jgi:hypothetical protein